MMKVSVTLSPDKPDRKIMPIFLDLYTVPFALKQTASTLSVLEDKCWGEQTDDTEAEYNEPG